MRQSVMWRRPFENGYRDPRSTGQGVTSAMSPIQGPQLLFCHPGKLGGATTDRGGSFWQSETGMATVPLPAWAILSGIGTFGVRSAVCSQWTTL